MSDGFVGVPEIEQRLAQIVMRCSVIWLEPNRLPKALERLGLTVLLVEQTTEVVPSLPQC